MVEGASLASPASPMSSLPHGMHQTRGSAPRREREREREGEGEGEEKEREREGEGKGEGEGEGERGATWRTRSAPPPPHTTFRPWVHPTPYTLHPAPYTLHPTPYTLHPSPYTPRAAATAHNLPSSGATSSSSLLSLQVLEGP